MENTTMMFINKMIIHNFKGVKDLTINFEKVTNIYAQNGGFKTTIADAWYWVLYGKDSQDRKDFNIKNTADTTLNRGDHEVSVFITTGSNQDFFKRVFREKWTKPKGQKDQVYTGNENLFYCNDVPMQAKEYQAKIDSIIAEGALKLLTNPNHFNSLKWTDRRNILFDLAGNVSDTEIAGSRPEFMALMASLSNKSLAEYKREVSAKKKKLKDDLQAIPTRIDELQRSMPEELDYDIVQAEINEKTQEIDVIEQSMNDRTKAYDDAYKIIQAKQNEIHGLKTKLNSLRHRIETEAQNTVNTVSMQRNEYKNTITSLESDIKSKSLLIESSEKKVKDLATKTEQLRSEWIAKNETEIKFKDGEFDCPTCKRPLDHADVESKSNILQQNFNNDKTYQLGLIESKAASHKLEVESTNSMVATLKEALKSLKGKLDTANSEYSTFQNQNTVPMGGASTEFKLAKDSEYIQLNSQLEALESTITDTPKIDLSDLREHRQIIAAELDTLKIQMSTKSQREAATKRLSDLENDESNFAQQIADMEGIEFTIDDFNRAKIETTESRINGIFRDVTFKLFDKKIDGDEFEVCETMYQGVPFSDLNTAGKIWAGIDIINTLSRHYGLSAPIFLDNRESVTLIPDINSQIINLIVSPEDKTLRVA